jgi:hypothetical protein
MAEPYCLAMVLCDNVHRDATTGKFTILGTFSTVGAQDYPLPIRFFVYFAVTDGHGQFPVSLRIASATTDISGEASDQNEVFNQKLGDMNFPSPLAVIESVAIVQVLLNEPGHYHCELHVGEKILMSRRLLAIDPKTMGDIQNG